MAKKKFNPDREYINSALREYASRNGTITVIEPEDLADMKVALGSHRYLREKTKRFINNNKLEDPKKAV